MKKSILILFVTFVVLVGLPLASVDAVGNSRNQVNPSSSQGATETESEDSDDSNNLGNYLKNKGQEMKLQNEQKKDQVRAEVTERVKERLQFVIQNAVNRYERVKAQVNNSNLTEEEKLEINNQIDAQIEKLDVLLAELDQIEDIAELKSVMKQVRSGFKISLGVVRQSVKGVYENRLTDVVERINVAFGRVSERVESLEEGDRKELLRERIAVVQELINEAVASIESGNLMEAQENLVLARTELREIIEEIRLISSL